ncbi:hypothetical protein NKH85_17090 [Mesorhizobium sp. M0924]|uniref:hypothetical protein n=1 Tax=unclassified Mesorhizobium TaxID=325217 RepID=UPI0033359B2C
MDGLFAYDRGNQLDDELTIIRHPRMSMFDTVKRLGLATNCKLILDAGDKASYSGSGQVWSDISGQGNNFNLGASNAANTDDPTFSGSPGIRGSNYFSSDGGDFFRMAVATPAWMQNLHKDGALATYLMWGYAPTTGALVAFGDGSTTFANIGVLVGLGSGGSMTYLVNRANAGAAGILATGPAFTRNVWGLYSFSINENGGATASFMGINNSYSTFDAAVTSPSASNASFTPEVMAGGNGVSIAGNGSRVGSIALWEGVALSQANVTDIFNYTRGRYGV